MQWLPRHSQGYRCAGHALPILSITVCGHLVLFYKAFSGVRCASWLRASATVIGGRLTSGVDTSPLCEYSYIEENVGLGQELIHLFSSPR